MKRLIAATLAAIVVGATASMAWASPLWGSDEVRARRTVAETDVLAFDLRREATGSARPAGKTEQAVTLARDFTLIAEGPRRTLEDHALCRVMAWTPASGSLENQSCYASVAFREAEVGNRAMIAKVIAKAGSASEAQLLYWGEAELGVSARSSLTAPLTVQARGDAVEYRLGDTVVARVSGSAGDISAEEMRRVVRFLARDINLHPQVRRDLAAKGRLPARIEVETGPIKAGDGRRVIEFSGLRRSRAAYPLPAGLESVLAREGREGSGPRALAVRRIAGVLAGNDPRPTVEATMAALRKAAAEGRDLETVLLFQQLIQDHMAVLKATDPASRAIVNELRAVVQPRMTSGEAGAFMNAGELAGDGKASGDRQAAARFLALNPKIDTLPFGTFRGVTYANLLAVSGDTKGWDPAIAKAMPTQRVDNYWIHIAAHPWAGNAFKDAGDAYYAGLDPQEAWIAFDLGRAVDPEWRAGGLANLAAYEEALRARQPDFF